MIGIFRTNINTAQDKNNVIKAISDSFNVTGCSVDIEDCDKVLRIVTEQHTLEEIVLLVQHMGYQCTVLE